MTSVTYIHIKLEWKFGICFDEYGRMINLNRYPSWLIEHGRVDNNQNLSLFLEEMKSTIKNKWLNTCSLYCFIIMHYDIKIYNRLIS